MIWNEKIDEVDTFEAFFKDIIFENNILIIPYINLGISHHPLNPSNKLSYLNKAYIVCIDACINLYNGTLVDDCSKQKFKGYQNLHLAGVDINLNKHIEFKIFCKTAFLQTLEDSKLSEKFWIPINTPHLERNMDVSEVDNFLNRNQFQDHLREILENNR